MRCQFNGHPVHQGIVVDKSAGCVKTARAVYMAVNKTRNRIGSFEFDDFESRFADKCGGASRGDDLIPVAKDRTGRDILMRSQAVVR